MATSDLTTENISQVPYNINGNHHYKIPVSGRNWHKLQEDGRVVFYEVFNDEAHETKLRKLVNALGHIPCCNDTYPKYTSGKGRNTYALTRIGLNLQ